MFVEGQHRKSLGKPASDCFQVHHDRQHSAIRLYSQGARAGDLDVKSVWFPINRCHGKYHETHALLRADRMLACTADQPQRGRRVIEVRKINLRKGDNVTSDYLAIKSLHKVPVLIVDGRALTENVAIRPISRRPTGGQTASIQFNGRTGSHFDDGLVQRRPPSASDPHLQSDEVLRRAGVEEALRVLAKKALEENFAAADKRLAGRNSSLIISLRRTHISFGARAAPRSSISRWTAMRTSLRTTIACINATARKRRSRSRRRRWRSSQRREANDYVPFPRWEFGPPRLKRTKSCHLWSAVRM